MSFNLEEAITTWRRELQRYPGMEPGDIEELETHLRDAIDDLSRSGMTEEAAFEKVVNEKFDQLQVVSGEYYKSRIKDHTAGNSIARINPFHMLPINLKIAFRSLLRSRADSLLNISGLAIAIASAGLIFQYILFETSYDNYLNDSDRIYRIAHRSFNTNDGSLRAKFASTFYAVAADAKDEIPEVEAATKTLRVEGILRRGVTNFRESRLYFAASDFFEVFDLPLVRGNPADLDGPDVIFLSESLARKYFGDEDAFGKHLEISLTGGPTHQLEVRGIFEDLPENSHMSPEAFLPLVNFVNNVNDNNLFGERRLSDVRWRLVGWYQYVLLKARTSEHDFNSKINALLQKNRGTIDESRGVKNEFFLERLDRIHLSEKLNNELQPKGDQNIILFLKIIFVTILVLGWINYINLTTAKAINRAKEVGIRKVVGSTRSALIIKFITESLMVNLMAVVTALILALVFIPYYHELVGKEVFSYLEGSKWILFLVILLSGIAVSSVYPALVLSSFKPAAILKGKFKNSGRGVVLRKSLVTFQFMVSLVLLAAIYVLYEQLKYMRNYDLGFDMEQTLVLRGPSVNDSTTNQRLKTFANIIGQEVDIVQATASGSVPGGEIVFRTAGRPVKGMAYGDDVFVRRIIAYENFIDFYGFELIAGRPFDATRALDRNAIILNREAVEQFGFEDPESALNKRIAFVLSDTFEIVGVVENFAQQGLQVAYVPIGFQMNDSGPAQFISVKTSIADIPQTLSYLEEKYVEFFPGDPFEYFFLNEHFNAQYQSEEKYGKILGLFTMIAIVIACLGLLGLTSFMVRLRLKEIAIRKVLGASNTQIINVLTREYFQLILIASVFGIPFAFYGTYQWIETFAFKIDLGLWHFIVPVLLIVIITLVTIGRISVRAATSNPVNSLKEE